jgi:hypothetical protein
MDLSLKKANALIENAQFYRYKCGVARRFIYYPTWRNGSRCPQPSPLSREARRIARNNGKMPYRQTPPADQSAQAGKAQKTVIAQGNARTSQHRIDNHP